MANGLTKLDGVLEIDHDRGVIYFHENTGQTRLRICRLRKPIPRSTELIDVTADPKMVAYDAEYRHGEELKRTGDEVTIHLKSGQEYTFQQGYDYEIITMVPGVERRPRVSRMSFLGTGPGYGEHGNDTLVFNARPYAGTQSIRASWVLGVCEVSNEIGRPDDTQRFTSRRADAAKLAEYGLDQNGEFR